MKLSCIYYSNRFRQHKINISVCARVCVCLYGGWGGRGRECINWLCAAYLEVMAKSLSAYGWLKFSITFGFWNLTTVCPATHQGSKHFVRGAVRGGAQRS
jgi:hypothetical protein